MAISFKLIMQEHAPFVQDLFRNELTSAFNSTSMALHRPDLLRWSAYTSECVDVLESSSDAYASDRVLCQWVKLQHIAEDVGVQFSMDDPLAQVGMSDTKLRYTLRGFERQLEDWRKQVPKELHARKSPCQAAISQALTQVSIP